MSNLCHNGHYIVLKNKNNQVVYANDIKATLIAKKIENDFKNELYISDFDEWYNCSILNIVIDGEDYKLCEYHNITKEKDKLIKCEKEAQVDTMTQVYNLNGIKKKIKKLLHNNHISNVIMIDVDDFKNINDTYTHAGGNIVLQNISKIFKEQTTKEDIVGRYGGDEFIIILCNKKRDEAFKIAENIRKAIDETKFIYNNLDMHVTVTMGIKECNENCSFEDITSKADVLLYEGKQKGKNIVISDNN